MLFEIKMYIRVCQNISLSVCGVNFEKWCSVDQNNIFAKSLSYTIKKLLSLLNFENLNHKKY